MRAVGRLPLALAVFVSAAPALARADGEWKTFETKDNVTYEKHPFAGSKFDEYRATFVVPKAAPAVQDAIWRNITESTHPRVKRRDVLRSTANELLIYEQVGAPIVSDRDVTLRIRRLPANAAGALEVRFDSANDAGPPPDPKFVRLPLVRGSWMITPLPDGTSRVVYTCFSEPGGSIPASFVRGSQQDQVVTDVKNVLGRLGAPPR